jgi:crotonobetainyl-CoA:carnitine CoA-transferase CaiB-like acyl-CoA transferase
MTSVSPLSDFLIVELGHNVAGPVGGQILAELGATVIKVEDPGKGDAARHWPPVKDGSSIVYKALNRSKSGVTVDFNNSSQLTELKELIIQKADAVIQNLRPGVVEKYGLDAETLRAEKPALIYCNIGAYGAVGPMSGKPGYDVLMQGYGGLMSVQGEPNGPPMRAGSSINDIGTGMWAAIAIQAALLERSRTGDGGVIDLSLYETAVSWISIHLASYLSTGKAEGKQGSGNAYITPYQAFRARDGHLMIGAANDVLFAKTAAVLGKPEWPIDPKYAKNADRVARRMELVPMIEAELAKDDVSTWVARFDAAGVPACPIRDVMEVADCPQTAALGLAQQSPDDPSLRLIGLPLSMNGTRPPMRNSPPELGRDNKTVFGRD